MTHERELRSDAKQNYDRLLDAAASAFAREGADTSLKAIARDAEVGIGTLYRRFPTRDDLIEATYRDQTARLSQRADELLAELPPGNALRAWMDGFVDYMNTKHGMSEALPGILAAREGLRSGSRTLLRDAIGTIVDAGIADGSMRPDTLADDVMMALGGVTMISGYEGDAALAGRLLDLLMNGLRVL
jgi:AcrR family transcriptional regulator